MAKTKNKETGLEVYDAENGKFVEVTKESQHLAAYIHQQALLGTFITAVAINKMIEERHYLSLGFSSRDEYIDTALPYGRRQTYKLLAIAKKFDSISKSLMGGDLKLLNSGEALEVHPTALNGNEKDIAEMGLEKLYQLTRLEDDDLKKLVKSGKVDLGNNETLDDIKDMTARELSEKIREIKQKYQAKVSQQSESLKLLKSEKEQLEDERNKLAEQNKTAKELEMKYGPAASKLKHKAETLDEARRLLNEFIEVTIRAGVNTEDPENMKKDLVDLIRKTDDAHKTLMANYDEVVVEF